MGVLMSTKTSLVQITISGVVTIIFPSLRGILITTIVHIIFIPERNNSIDASI